MKKELMLGNEAIARGAWEAGVRVVSSYPGTPSTEVTEYAAKYPEIYSEWAVNEKVALEVAVGASVAGARALCCMKHVGLNVAADPLFTAAYTGVNGGLVLNVADDPGMHSSQNEQDSRNYARGAHVPMLEPSDSEECLSFTKYAFQLSEEFDTPVIVRTTTRIAHARSAAGTSPREEIAPREYQKDIAKYVMMPGMARARHVVVEKRMEALADMAETSPLNRAEMRSPEIGVLCSGMAYQYVREALPDASILKLGIVHPLPRRLIESFALKVKRFYVIEELEPMVETQIRAWGIEATGKELTGLQGELSVRKIRSWFDGAEALPFEIEPLPARAPVMCAGCPHRGPFHVLSKLKMRVTGDIGCYTLGAFAPLAAIDTTLCMGASVGMAQGFEHARGREFSKNTVAVIGDSTFLHSGVTSLINAVYNKTAMTLMILDNRITGMTGHQPNPATGFDIHGEPAKMIDLEALCRACGVERVRIVDAFDLAGLEAAVREETSADGVSVIIARRPCALIGKKERGPAYTVDEDSCVKCLACMKIGCPAIAREGGKIKINPSQCVGCGLCAQCCRSASIKKAGE